MFSRIIICILVLLISISLFGQQFYRSEGLSLFNQGHFLTAIDEMKNWADTYASEKGIAYYYIGECYYNLGLASENYQTASSHFSEALTYFENAFKQTDLIALFADKSTETKYKIGWCHFRLAEIGKEPEHFSQAAVAFQNLASENRDSISVYAAYLLGESQLRHAQHLQYLMHVSTNPGEIENLSREIYHLLTQSEIAFQAVSAMKYGQPFLRACAIYRLQDIQISLGKLFWLMENGSVRAFPVYQEGATGISLARDYFSQVDYFQTLNSLNQIDRAQFLPMVYYGEMVNQLYQHLISDQMTHRQMFNQYLDSLKWGEFQNEKLLFKGMADQKSQIDSDEFNLLTHSTRSAYARAARIYPEAWYWLALVQYISGDYDCLSHFNTFIKESGQPFSDPRLDYLLEDASYRVLQLTFDQHADDRTKLRQIKKQLSRFHPKYGLIQERRDQLLRLTRVGLGENIWTEILQAATVDDKLDDAFYLIRQMLIRASSVVGKERVPYLRYLDRLFNITGDRRAIETTFYRGMAQFLRAEIQETAQNKRQFYFDAADILNSSLKDYQNEGMYIQARSYFSAAKHEVRLEQREQTYDKAKPIFIQLINESGSLRSLYYLAEIFRLRGNHLAARSCYQTVIQKTKDQPDGGFWYENAKAGLSSCRSQGDISVLKDIRFQNVRFPDFLLKVDGKPISLEKFADPAYVRNQYWEEALNMIKKYGPPKRDIYPSVFTLAHSSYAAYAFTSLNAGIHERTGTVYSGLRLQILFPGGVKDAIVRLDGIPLKKNAKGLYQKAPIALNERMNIFVEAPLCYPYVKDHVFIQPGLEQVLVPLLPQMSFHSGEPVLEEGMQIFRFDDRLDNNVVILSGSVPITPSMPIIQDFESDVGFRDFAYSQFHNGFFAAHARKQYLFFYQGNGLSMKRSDFKLTFPNYKETLGSVEGVAVDLNGNIYIVDWKKHRIVKFNDAGVYQMEIGTLGRNTSSDVGKSVKLTYPARISLSEDRDGVEVNGVRTYRPPVIFITDRNGVHIVSYNGNYWDTLDLRLKRKEDISTITAKGYGTNVRLYVAIRQNPRIKKYVVGSD